MESVDSLVIVTGGILTLLALVAAIFIVLEVVHLAGDLIQSRHDLIRIGRRRASVTAVRPNDTAPLSRNHVGKRDGLREEPVTIKAMKDADVVRQMIRHFEGGEEPSDDG